VNDELNKKTNKKFSSELFHLNKNNGDLKDKFNKDHTKNEKKKSEFSFS